MEPGEGIDFGTLTRSHKTAQHRAGSATDIPTKEHPVGASHCHAANAALGGGVVDFQIAIFGVAGQRFPAFET